MYGRNNATTWTDTPPVYSSPSTSSGSLQYPNFDPGPGPSGVHHQPPFFQFPHYPSVPVPFDYPQVLEMNHHHFNQIALQECTYIIYITRIKAMDIVEVLVLHQVLYK